MKLKIWMVIKAMKPVNNYLENQVDKLIDYLIKSNKGFGWKNQPKRNFKGIYIEGEPFDYIITLPSKIMCFDTKQKTKGHSWHMKDKDKKQAIRLKKLAEINPQIKAFLLFYFAEYCELRAIDIDKVFKVLSTTDTIHKNDCYLFKFKEVFNIE
jgi:hypothetical protein